MKHHCHARDCLIEVKPELLMCWHHWKQVPKNIQQAIYFYYREGQCDDKSPSEEWHIAADASIGYIAQKENKIISINEKNALLQFGIKIQ